MAVPALAEAQRGRPGRGASVRSVVIVRGYSYPRYWYDPWYQWGPYQYPYPPYGFRYSGLDNMTASVRLQVAPRDAQVFVDGYAAGIVDDFDGVLQRLRLRPGGHEITVFLEGYETVREALYLAPGADRKLTFTLNRLREGEQSEPPPPPAQVEEPGPDQTGLAPAGPRSPVPATRNEPPTPRQAPDRFGTLSIRVQPGDAEIVIDGERWAAPVGQDRIAIQLAEGRHHVEVRREGFSQYAEDVLIRRGATFTLNVSLLRGATQ
jgi:PEGA domain